MRGNQNLLISNNSFRSSGGTALSFLNNNYKVTVLNCYFGYNVNNSNNGGAISMDINNSYVSIVRTIFDSNLALSGGAIYVNNMNNYLTIASCNFSTNTAVQDGGAVYVNDEHSNFVLLDYTTYSSSFQLQTSHPYTNGAPVNGKPYVIYSKLVQMTSVLQYIITFDSQSIIFSSTFTIYTNTNKTTIIYQNKGQNTWPGVNAPNLVIYSSQFYIELVGPSQNIIFSNNYFGFLCNVYPIYLRENDIINFSSSSIFYGNTARNGGGLFLNFINTFSILLAIDFISNSASMSGGALNVFLSNYGQTLQLIRFINNTASTGGGMSLASSNYGIQIIGCLFLNNTAVQGSGIFFSAYNGQGAQPLYNEVLINNSYFIANHADEGGGVLIKYENVININNVSFIDNTATSLGAGINVDTSNVVNISSSIFTNNQIIYNYNGIGGGAIASQVSNTININSTVFKNNSASSSGAGGALLLDGDTALTVIGSNKFLRNSADLGGAIYGKNIPLWTTTNDGSLTLIENEARIGSAISIALFSSLETILTNITMIDNSAQIAGTFFWLCTAVSSNLSSCQEPKYNNVVFINNSAPYGFEFATQPIHIRTTSEYNVTVYGRPLSPAINLTLYDFYNSKAVSDSFTATTATVAAYNCGGFVGTLQSATVEFSNQGVVSFSDIATTCNPNGNLTIMYTSQPSAMYFYETDANSEYNFNTISVWNLRSCYNGEKYYNGLCQSCPNSTYSLVYSESQSCLACPPEAADCYANNINLLPGYWRISTLSDTILSCPYMGCKGGYGVTEALCDEGYKGVLCSVCSSGYYYNQDLNQCILCKNSDVISTSAIFFFAALFILLLGVCIYTYVKFLKSTIPDDDNIDESALQNNSNLKEVMKKMDSFNQRIGPVMAKGKIIISTFQILSTSLASFSIQMPPSYTKFMSSFNFISLDIVNVMPLGCVKRLSFIASLLIKTVLPPAFIGLLFVIFIIEFSIRRRKIIRKKPDEVQLKASLILLMSSLKFRYISLALLFSYINLPGLTVSIFQTFVCIDIDPTNAIYPNGSYYLVADYSINCNSSEMTFARVYAAVMIILYPVGIPCLYFRLLYKKRDELKHRDDILYKGRRKDVKKNKIKAFVEANALNVNDDNSLKRSTQMFKFLYDSYKPQYWYFEIIETTRRLMLTAVLSVIASGSSTQVVCGLMLSLMYMKIYAYYQPYSLEESSILAELAQYQIYFSFFGSLIIQNNLLPSGLNTAVAVMMILLNLSTTLLASYFECRASTKESSTEGEKESNNKVTHENGGSNTDSSITVNPLQHRVTINTDNNNKVNTDVEMATYSSSIDDKKNSNDDDNNDNDNGRQSYVKQIITKFETRELVLRHLNTITNNKNDTNNNKNNTNNNDDYDSDDDF